MRPLHMVILGALAVLVTTLPIVAAGRDASFSFQWDRYTAQGIFGVAMLVAGFTFGYVRPPARWLFLFALLVSGVVTNSTARSIIATSGPRLGTCGGSYPGVRRVCSPGRRSLPLLRPGSGSWKSMRCGGP